jgi:uncharacterized protein
VALILDTSTLYAALDRRDARHRDCRDLLERAEEMLIVPSPVLPELDYLVAGALGTGAMVAFLADVEDGAFVIEDLLFEDYPRVRDLVDRYSDADVGFVDAAVLAITERLAEPKLATLDRRHFSLMRPRHVEALALLPD